MKIASPAPAGEPASLKPNGTDATPERLDTLRELRVEVQDLQALLRRVRAGQVALSTYAACVGETKSDIAALLDRLAALGRDPGIDVDSVRRLHNVWRQMTACPLLAQLEVAHATQDLLHWIELLDGQCRELVVIIGGLTIPERLNVWLSRAWAGYHLSFHAVFDDELPEREDRQRLLNHLAYAPAAVAGGIIDPRSGLIYRYHSKRWQRYGVVALLVLGFVAATLLVWGSRSVLPIVDGEKPPSEVDFLVRWFALFIGVIVHVAVDKPKRAQGADAPPAMLAIGHLSHRIDAHIGVLSFRLAMMLIGFFGLLFLGGHENFSPLNLFLVGYSLDSFIDVFAAAVEKRATSRIGALKKELGVGE